MRSLATAVARVQEKYRSLARGRSIVDELLAERGEEVRPGGDRPVRERRALDAEPD